MYRFQSGFRYIGLFSEKTDIQPIADTNEGSLTRNSTTRKHTRSQYVEQIFRFKRIIELVLLHFFLTNSLHLLITVIEKLKEDADCEIATTELRVSLMCPLGKMRMTTPCR